MPSSPSSATAAVAPAARPTPKRERADRPGLPAGTVAFLFADVTGSTAAQEVAVDLVRRGGTVVLAGRTPKKTIPFVMDKLTSRGIKMVGVRAHDSDDVRKAVAVAMILAGVVLLTGGSPKAEQRSEVRVDG